MLNKLAGWLTENLSNFLLFYHVNNRKDLIENEEALCPQAKLKRGFLCGATTMVSSVREVEDTFYDWKTYFSDQKFKPQIFQFFNVIHSFRPTAEDSRWVGT